VKKEHAGKRRERSQQARKEWILLSFGCKKKSLTQQGKEGVYTKGKGWNLKGVTALEDGNERGNQGDGDRVFTPRREGGRRRWE